MNYLLKQLVKLLGRIPEYVFAEVWVPHGKGVLFLSAIFLSTPVVSSEARDVETQLRQIVDNQVTSFVTQQLITANEKKIDVAISERFRGRDCEDMRWSRKESSKPPLGRLSFRIECQAPEQWSARAVVKVQIWTEAFHAQQDVFRGELLTEDMLVKDLVELSNARSGYFTNLSELIGLKAKRLIKKGKLITSAFLEPVLLVKKGQTVTIESKGSGFLVSTQGEALANGSLGSRIPIRNLTSGKTIEGVVVRENVVQVR